MPDTGRAGVFVQEPVVDTLAAKHSLLAATTILGFLAQESQLLADHALRKILVVLDLTLIGDELLVINEWRMLVSTGSPSH